MCINIHTFDNELSKVIIDISGKNHTWIRGQLATTLANYYTIALISHASKVMLKILQARVQQYVNWELPDVQAGSRKGKGTRDQITNVHWIIKKAREFQKNIYFCFIDYTKAFECVDHKKLWKILQEMGLPDHLTFLLRNLYAGQEAIVRTEHGTTDWFQIGKRVLQGCMLSPCLFNFYETTKTCRTWNNKRVYWGRMFYDCSYLKILGDGDKYKNS